MWQWVWIKMVGGCERWALTLRRAMWQFSHWTIGILSHRRFSQLMFFKSSIPGGFSVFRDFWGHFVFVEVAAEWSILTFTLLSEVMENSHALTLSSEWTCRSVKVTLWIRLDSHLRASSQTHSLSFASLTSHTFCHKTLLRPKQGLETPDTTFIIKSVGVLKIIDSDCITLVKGL